MNFNREILLPVDIRVESISRQALISRIRDLEAKNGVLVRSSLKLESEIFDLTHENKKLRVQVDLLLDRLIENENLVTARHNIGG
jgi:regulator of replication initiation timing